MNRRLNTVLDQSGADSVLPSPAGWEETILSFKRGSSLYEAHLPGSRVAECTGSLQWCLDSHQIANDAGPLLLGGRRTS